MQRFGFLLLTASLLTLVAAPSLAAPAATFRGDARHTGIYPAAASPPIDHTRDASMSRRRTTLVAR